MCIGSLCGNMGDSGGQVGYMVGVVGGAGSVHSSFDVVDRL